MTKNKLIYIDVGSRNNSGLYSKEILDSLNINFEMHAYLHHKYPYEHNIKTSKIFNRFSSFFYPRIIKQLYNYVDLSIWFMIIAIKLLFNSKKKIIVVLQLYAPFRFYYYALRLMKMRKNIKIALTIHDAAPLYNNYPKYVMISQEKLIILSDYLFVHTNESYNQLLKYNKEIYRYSFPLMRLPRTNSCQESSLIRFLFIGYLRKEKGIDLLISAWKKVSDQFNNIKLIIAGEVPFNLVYQFEKLNKSDLFLEYIDDNRYTEFVCQCDYVILPYTKGTNSGILSTIASLNKLSITSDLPMFIESDFVLSELVFQANSVDALVDKLHYVIENHYKIHENLEYILQQRVQNYVKQFSIGINEVYSKILSDNQ